MLLIWAYMQSRMARDTGGTMVEYALILITISIVVLLGAVVVGSVTNDKYVDVKTCFDAVGSC